MSEYLGIAVTFALAGLIGGAFLFLASVLGPKRPSPAKSEPFECGEKPFELPSGHFSIRFYLVGMLFILFDIEVIFLYPWALVWKPLGLIAMVEMVIFLAILGVGVAYAWKKGVLECH